MDTDGRLNIPMAGELQVSGLLLPELEQLIRERASRYMRDPVVNVTVATSESKAYIGGEVIDEGFVTLTRPMTVLQAVFERGGFTPGADLSDVVILSHEEGKAVSRLIDLEAELEGDPSERTLLAADEIPDAPIDPSTLSRDDAVGEAYVADPLVWHGPFKRQTLEAIQETLAMIRFAGAVDDPILWLHGEADQLVPIADTRWGWESLAGRHASAKSYPGARHEIFNETNQDEVLDDVIAFIRANLPGAAAS